MAKPQANTICYPRPATLKRKIRVLCLDIEGGYGGSSRSLYESIAHLDRAAVVIEVWCKRKGPIQERYKSIGVPVSIFSSMPKVSSLPKISRNLYAYSLFVLHWLMGRPFRRELLTAARQVDVVHFNHESLFWAARWL